MSADAPTDGVLIAPDPVNAISAPATPDPSKGADERVLKKETKAPARTYMRFVHASLPQWLAMMDPAPWLTAGSLASPIDRGGATTLYRQQAATLAVALLAEANPPECDRAYLQECVRTSLIRWQLSLRSDGVPSRRSLRRSPLHGLIAGCVVHVLSDAGGFESNLLLDDLERHVAWIARRQRRAPWLEATTIGLMADTAMLVRDRALLTRARHRLAVLLHAQDSEGWFPERGGPDLGRLSVVVDAFARLYRNMQWNELSGPLQRALSFTLHCMRPNGSVGGCISSCGTGFVSPYGVELVASEIPEAAALALACRKRFGRFTTQCAPTWHADLWAVLGPRIALASSIAKEETAPPADLPFRLMGTKHFPNAGFSIHRSKNYHAIIGGKSGGAVQVSWRGGEDMEEPGVVVFFPHGTRTSARWHRHTLTATSETGVTSRGTLRRPYRSIERPWSMLKRFVGRLVRLRGNGCMPRPPACVDVHAGSTAHVALHARPRRPHTRDSFRRDVLFAEESIRIRDVVEVRSRCQAVLCQSQPVGESGHLVDRDTRSGSGRCPIFVDGDRHVVITRLYRSEGLVNYDSQTQGTSPSPAAS